MKIRIMTINGLMAAALGLCAMPVPAAANVACDLLDLRPGTPISVKSGRGDFVLQVDPEVQAAINDLHDGRRAIYEKGFFKRSLEKQSRALRVKDPNASLLFGVTTDGQLIGIIKPSDNPPPPYQIWTYALSDKPKLKEVRLSKGQIGDREALCVRFYDQKDKEYNRLLVTPFDAIADDTSSAFKSVCGKSQKP